MFQEKKKWNIQKESSFNSSFLTELSLPMLSQLTDAQESYNLSDKITNSNASLEKSSQTFDNNLTAQHNSSKIRHQQLQLTVKRVNYSSSDDLSETILVDATDCPASLCYDVRSLCCVNRDLHNAKPLNGITSHFKILYNDRVLSPALSFAFQGVKNGGELCIIQNSDTQYSKLCTDNEPTRNSYTNQIIKNTFLSKSRRDNMINRLHQRFDRKWGSMFFDSDSVFDQIKNSLDPITSNESARLSDIKHLRAVENNAIYQKVCQRYQMIEANSMNCSDKIEKTFFPTVIGKKQMEPSSCPLPDLVSKQNASYQNKFVMTNVASTSSCRDRVFSNELFEKF